MKARFKVQFASLQSATELTTSLPSLVSRLVQFKISLRVDRVQSPIESPGQGDQAREQ
jgi:hypothetical protein